MSSTSFGAQLISGATYPKLGQNRHYLDQKARVRPTGILTVESRHETLPSHLEGEFKPIKQVVSQNVQVGTRRLEPLSKTEELLAFLMPYRIDILQAHRTTAVALHLGVFQGIVFFLREALW